MVTYTFGIAEQDPNKGLDYQVTIEENVFTSYKKVNKLNKVNKVNKVNKSGNGVNHPLSDGDYRSTLKWQLDQVELVSHHLILHTLDKKDLSCIMMDPGVLKCIAIDLSNNYKYIKSGHTLASLIKDYGKQVVTSLTQYEGCLQVGVTLSECTIDPREKCPMVLDLAYVLYDSGEAIGFYDIGQYHYLTGYNLPGYHSQISHLFPSFSDELRDKECQSSKPKQLTLGNGTTQRTFVTKDNTIYILEWRPILTVSQYFYEIYRLVKLPNLPFNQLLSDYQLGDLSSIKVNKAVYLPIPQNSLAGMEASPNQLFDIIKPMSLNIPCDSSTTNENENKNENKNKIDVDFDRKYTEKREPLSKTRTYVSIPDVPNRASLRPGALKKANPVLKLRPKKKTS